MFSQTHASHLLARSLTLTHLSASYTPLYCIQLDIRWSMCTNVLLHDMNKTTTHIPSISSWLGVFNVNAYAKGWCSDGNLSHSLPLKWLENRTRNGFWGFFLLLLCYSFFGCSMNFSHDCAVQRGTASLFSLCMNTHTDFYVIFHYCCYVPFRSVPFDSVHYNFSMGSFSRRNWRERFF